MLLCEVKSFPLEPGRIKGLGRTGSQGEKSVWVSAGKKGRSDVPQSHPCDQRRSDSLSPPFGSVYSTWIATGTTKCHRIPIYYSRGWRGGSWLLSTSSALSPRLSLGSTESGLPKVLSTQGAIVEWAPGERCAHERCCRQAMGSCQEWAKIPWQGFIILKGTNSN